MELKQNLNRGLTRRKILKYGLFGGLSATLSSSLWLSGCTKRPRAKRPNVILISIDTTRRDHCSVYGYSRNTTPNIFKIAERGVSFDTAYSPSSSTGPSHATMLTSLYPVEHGIVKNGLKLSEKQETIASYLSAQGYQTAAVVSAFVLNSKFGYGKGFSFFDDHLKSTESSNPDKTFWEGQKVEGGFDQLANYATPKVINWLNTQWDKKSPFFIFLHYWDPHYPYAPPEPFSSQFAPRNAQLTGLARIIGNYDGEIAFTDYEIEKILMQLKQMDIEEDTLIVITSDHGEGFMQHGHMGHGVHIYEEAVRVPLIFYWPNGIPKGRVLNAPVGLISLTPTILDLIGINSKNSPFNGHSLAPAIHGETSLDPNQPVYIYRRHYKERNVGQIWVKGDKYGIRLANWKYIEGKEEQTKELFDLSADPYERTNLYSVFPKRSAELASELEAWKHKHVKTDSAPGKIAEEDLAPLKSLGYVE